MNKTRQEKLFIEKLKGDGGFTLNGVINNVIKLVNL